LRPFTETIPKPLLPIGEKAILEIQIERLNKFGFNEVFLATNYKSEYISNFFGDGSKYGVKLKISKEKKQLGTAGPLTLLKNELDEPFLVMNGDILTLIDFKKFYNYAISKNCPLTVAIKKEITPFAFGNILFDKDFVTYIEEKPNFVNYILGGIYVMTPKVFNTIPENTYYGMDMLIKEYLKNQVPIAKYEMDEYWLDIGRINDYKETQGIYEKHFKGSKK
jgi:NDP-mannose synthase